MAFLKTVMESAPDREVDSIDEWPDRRIAGKTGAFLLPGLGSEETSDWTFELPQPGLKAGTTFLRGALDAWNMTWRPVDGPFKIVEDGRCRLPEAVLPKVKLGLPSMALRITRVQ